MELESLKKEAEEYAMYKANYGDKVGYPRNPVNVVTEAYIDSAEPREKQIQEKDKKIAELEHQLIHRNCLDCSNHSSKLRMRTLELEKENTELKKQLEMSNKVYNDNLDYSYHIEGQLTNAKEIIREFMKYEINEYDGSLEIHFEELKKQAEQFLKDSEVEK